MLSDQTYITKKGLEDLKKELDHLKKVVRIEIAERIAQAKELGDLSENAEYSDAKEAQGFNEGKIIEIEAMIKSAIIIEEENKTPGVASVGSKIKIKQEDTGKFKEYHIVGSPEANPLEGRISNESPIGQALLGGKVGDSVEISLPRGVIKCKIIKVE